MDRVESNDQIQKRITARRYIRTMYGECGVLRCPVKPTDLYQIGIQNEHGFHLRGSGTTLEAALQQALEELRQCSTSSKNSPTPSKPAPPPLRQGRLFNLPPSDPHFVPQHKRLKKSRRSSQTRANRQRANNIGNAAASSFRASRHG